MTLAFDSDADGDANLASMMHALGARARAAARIMAGAPASTRNHALEVAAAGLRSRTDAILSANAEDVTAARGSGTAEPLVERLTLDSARIDQIAAGLEAIAGLDDPVGAVIAEWTRPNGLAIARVRTALGVIGVIYESRPNVTADAGGLCLKSGNAVILRGGSESFHSSRAIHACLIEGLAAAGLPADAIQIVPSRDRAAVGAMLSGLDGNIDVIVPRGGKGLVERVQSDARVPVFAHLEGVCHVYVDRTADLEMARAVVVNAKMRRPSICGAAETLLVDRAAIESHLKPLLGALIEAGCVVRGDETVCAAEPRAEAATHDDWGREYLDAIISVGVIDGLDDAIAHIARFGSGHTEAIVTGDQTAAERFLGEVDSAIVMHNASTQFADGGEFGMGAEIGIATGRFHARGPVGVEQLTTFKYAVRGTGQCRP